MKTLKLRHVLVKSENMSEPLLPPYKLLSLSKKFGKKRDLGYKINRPMYKIYQLMPSWETKSNSQSLCISSKSPFLRGYSEKADSRSMAWDMSLNQLIHLICRRNWRLWLKKRIGKLEWGMHGVIRTKINVSSLMFCFTGSSKSFMTNIKQYQNIHCMLSL